MLNDYARLVLFPIGFLVNLVQCLEVVGNGAGRQDDGTVLLLFPIMI